MANVLLFHHALGLTPGMQSFADQLRAAGHAVTNPDLYDGAIHETIAAGVEHAERIGFTNLAERGLALAAGLEDPLIVGGFSLGVLPAQNVAQNRPGVAGAILYHGAVPASVFGDVWPAAVALQMHLTEGDELAEEDLDAARALAADAAGELHLYPGTGHLIADSSFADYDADQTGIILERTLSFLAAHG